MERPCTRWRSGRSSIPSPEGRLTGQSPAPAAQDRRWSNLPAVADGIFDLGCLEAFLSAAEDTLADVRVGRRKRRAASQRAHGRARLRATGGRDSSASPGADQSRRRNRPSARTGGRPCQYLARGCASRISARSRGGDTRGRRGVPRRAGGQRPAPGRDRSVARKSCSNAPAVPDLHAGPMFRCPATPVRKGVPGPEGYTATIAGHRERHPRAAARAGLLRKCRRHPLLAKRRKPVSRRS